MLRNSVPRVALILAVALTALTACGSFRMGSGGYRGMGEFKSPSEYSPPHDSQEHLNDEDMSASREELNRSANYRPRGAFQLIWPVKRVKFNRGFHPANDPKHSGIDFGGTRGAIIMAAHEGVVIYTGRDFRGYGNMILIEYNDEWATLYGHLDSFLVNEGAIVAPGTPIGTMGSTGRATGVHLHFEVMCDHSPVDPLPMLTRNTGFTNRSPSFSPQRKRQSRR